MPTHHKGSARENLALNTYIKLMRAGEALGARLKACRAVGDLTISQFAALEALYHLGPLRPNEISAKTLRSPGNITLVIDNLEKAGLVTRARAPDDRRALVVALTAKGKKVIAGILPGHIAAIVEQMSVLTPAEQEQLGELCKKLGTAAQSDGPRAA
jgi:MarR family 2-MHQ and catechol resistance regulon transcriptional repressor